MKKATNINGRFFIYALRNAGYTNYTAIADIIDNSLEIDVLSKNVYVNVNTKNKECIIDSISIIDDGVGMSSETLVEAMSLGSNTGKTLENDLGYYGVGLKTAALSIGQKLEVYTKKIDENILHYACLDITTFYETNTLLVEFLDYDVNSEEYNKFLNLTKSQSGTCVIISKLDKLSNKDFRSFSGTISLKIRQIFNKYILANLINFYVNNEKLLEFDPIGNKFGGYHFEILKEANIQFNDINFKYKFWYTPEKSDKKIDDNYWGVNHSGIFIYRQDRLVGDALDLGIAHTRGDNWGQGIKIEIFIDGNADNLFSTTFTKMISEKDKNMFDQSFKDILDNELKPLVDECIRSRKKNYQCIINADMKKSLDKITIDLNKNRFLKNSINTYGKNKNIDDINNTINAEHTPQKNPNPHKKRTDEWFAGFDYISDGCGGKMYQTITKNGKPYLQINTDHAFYKNILSLLSTEGQQLLGSYLACDILAKQKSDYWHDDNIKNIIDTYFEEWSDAVKRAFND